MKRCLTIFAIIATLVMPGSWMNKASAQAGTIAITYQDFYDGLSPYGEWMDYPEYGYVWRPTGVSGFQPYNTGGRWVWTDEYDWMWVSDYDWGWAPFHYGRWFHDPLYGWMWVPGYEWAPAWVAWRDGGDYYGWAPIRPGIHIGVNFNFGSYNPPIDYWNFAPRRYITSSRLWNYCVPRTQNVTIINNTTIINNYGRRGGNVFVNGPRRIDVERYTGRIRPVQFRESRTVGRTQIRRNQVSVYRPEIRRDNDRSYTPRQFNRYEGNNNVRTNNNRNDRISNGNNGRTIARPDRNINAPNRNERPANSNTGVITPNRPANSNTGRTNPSRPAPRINPAPGNNTNRDANTRRNDRINKRNEIPVRAGTGRGSANPQPGVRSSRPEPAPQRNPQIEQRVRTDRAVRENRIERRETARPQAERRITAPQQRSVQRAQQPQQRRVENRGERRRP